MNEGEAEAIVLNLIVHGGDAKSFAIEAIEAARRGEFGRADDLMRQSTGALNEAHEFQTKQIRKEVAGDVHEPMTMLMVHGQDHLMNAITVHDLAQQIVGLCKQLVESTPEKKSVVREVREE